MAYIISNSESRALIVQDVQTLERALPAIARPQGNGASAAGQVCLHKYRLLYYFWIILDYFELVSIILFSSGSK